MRLLIALSITGILGLGISGVAAAGGDDVSDLKAQMKAMEAQHQEEMRALMERIEALEAHEGRASAELVEELPAGIEEKVAKKAAAWTDKLRVKGSIWEYFLSENNSFFGKTSSDFLETSVKIGLEAQIAENITAGLELVAENAAGDAANYTGVTTDDWNVEAGLANITYSDVLDMPLAITVGRQNLEYGDGFLIYDGVADKRAVWSTPIRSFNAVKGVYQAGPWQLDAFAAIVDENYGSYETYVTSVSTRTGDRDLYGGNAHVESERFGTWDFGVFYRADDSAVDSDTLAVSQRGSYTMDLGTESAYAPQWTVEGELVEEFGRTKVENHALTTSRRDRETWGGHIDTTFSFARAPFTPYIKGSYIYLPGDDRETSENEAFDPMFYGWQDWGKWFIGSLNSYNLYNYNQRSVLAEAGLHPTETTMLRAQFFNTRLDQELTVGAKKHWSNEWNFILDWYPNDRFFAGGSFAYAHPLSAAKTYAGDSQDSTEVVMWAGVQF